MQAIPVGAGSRRTCSQSVHAVLPGTQLAATARFLDEVFVPAAGAQGAAVQSTVLKLDAEGSASVGAAICDYVAKVLLRAQPC